MSGWKTQPILGAGRWLGAFSSNRTERSDSSNSVFSDHRRRRWRRRIKVECHTAAHDVGARRHLLWEARCDVEDRPRVKLRVEIFDPQADHGRYLVFDTAADRPSRAGRCSRRAEEVVKCSNAINRETARDIGHELSKWDTDPETKITARRDFRSAFMRDETAIEGFPGEVHN